MVVAKLRLTPALELRVLAEEFRGHCDVHIREYALTNENSYVPTPRGVNVPIEKLEEVLDGVRELRAAGDKDGVVATINGDKGRAVQFAIRTWQGTTKADIRVCFLKKESGDLVPTQRGTRFTLGLLPELERALEALDRALAE